MKILRLTLAALALASLTLVSSAFRPLSSYSLTVVNHSSEDLGNVTFGVGSNSTILDIAPNSMTTDTTNFVTNQVTDNSQTIYSPGTGPITLPDGAKIRVNWTGTDCIDITKNTNDNSPMP